MDVSPTPQRTISGYSWQLRDHRSRPAPPTEMGRRLAGLLYSMLDSVLPPGTVAVAQGRPGGPRMQLPRFLTR